MILDTMVLQTQDFQIFAQDNKNKASFNGDIGVQDSRTSSAPLQSSDLPPISGGGSQFVGISNYQTTHYFYCDPTTGNFNVCSSTYFETVSYSGPLVSLEGDSIWESPPDTAWGTCVAGAEPGGLSVHLNLISFPSQPLVSGQAGAAASVFLFTDEKKMSVSAQAISASYCALGPSIGDFVSYTETDGKITASGGRSNSGSEPSQGDLPGDSSSYSDQWSVQIVPGDPQNNPPVARTIVSPSDVLQSGTTVTLDGSSSTDPDSGDSVQTYTWEQIGTPSVTLNNAITDKGDIDAGKANFISPELTQDTTLTFRLTVEDTHGALSSTSVDVLVKAPDVCGVEVGALSIPNPFQELGAAKPTIEISSNSFVDNKLSFSKLKSDKLVKLNPYNIKALSLKEAGDQFIYANPDKPSEVLASKTESGLKVRWYANSDNIVCKAKIIGKISVNYPELTTLKKLSQPAQTEWERFIDKTVNVHEAGHVKIIKDGYIKATHDILGKKPEEVKGIVDVIENNIKMENRAYDALTNHGATQGAILDINKN